MTGKKIDIAVIDSGIRGECVLNGKISAKIKFIAADQKKTGLRYRQSAFVHGTICAKIISGICPQVHYWI